MVPLICTTEFKRRSRQRVRELMESDPRIYLDIDHDWLSVLSLISSKFKVNGCWNEKYKDIQSIASDIVF